MTIHWGLLGWSNKRTGLEFYRWDEKTIPRHGSEWGDLLVQESDFAEAEGCPVIIVVLPRNTKKDGVIAATHAIQAALAAAPADTEYRCPRCGMPEVCDDPECGEYPADTEGGDRG